MPPLSPPPDSLVLGPERLSSSIPPQSVENDPSHSATVYLPAPQSSDTAHGLLSPRPPTYLTVDTPPPQSSQREFNPSMAQNAVGRTLTDGDVKAIAQQLLQMQAGPSIPARE